MLKWIQGGLVLGVALSASGAQAEVNMLTCVRDHTPMDGMRVELVLSQNADGSTYDLTSTSTNPWLPPPEGTRTQTIAEGLSCRFAAEDARIADCRKQGGSGQINSGAVFKRNVEASVNHRGELMEQTFIKAEVYSPALGGHRDYSFNLSNMFERCDVDVD